MKEGKIDIKVNGQYKNIDFKQLKVDEYIVLEKGEYNEGLEKEGKYGAYFIVSAVYDGEDVSFFMNPKVHEQWANTGGLGDKVIISKYEEKVKVKSGTLLVERLKVSAEVPTKEAPTGGDEEDLLS